MLNKNTKFDFKKLHKALSDTYKRQMEIKKEFPHRFEYPTYDCNDRSAYKAEMDVRQPWWMARAEFDRLSVKMTMLCCIINHAKGKLHMKSFWWGEPFNKENQEYFILPAYKEFELAETDELGTPKENDSVVVRFVPKRTPVSKKRGFVQRLLGI